MFPKTIGPYTVTTQVVSHFKLDGGAMFGSVPKVIWNKLAPADDANRILLVCRVLILQSSDRTILVDTGCGKNWESKLASIFSIDSISLDSWNIRPADVTDIILTHLHFDHAGGLGVEGPTGVRCGFPNATIYIQRANEQHAKSPGPKELASYRKVDLAALGEAKKMVFLDGDCECLPNIFVHRVDGHTVGQQWIEIADENNRLFFATDLIPTSNHIRLPYHMGYDINASQLISEKSSLLMRAAAEDALLVFEHDPLVEAAKISPINGKSGIIDY